MKKGQTPSDTITLLKVVLLKCMSIMLLEFTISDNHMVFMCERFKKSVCNKETLLYLRVCLFTFLYFSL